MVKRSGVKVWLFPAAAAAGVFLSLMSAGTSGAELSRKYPVRRVEIIVPYSPGGGVDTNCRALVPSLEKALGTKIIVVNRPGAGGVLGFTVLGNARNDGSTLGLAALSSLCSNAALGDFAMDPRKAFSYLGGVVFDPAAIAVSKNSPFDTLDELVAYARSHPDELSYGATGNLSLDAMLCRDLMHAGGIKLNMVNFNGGAESMAALMGGHIQVMGGTLSEVSAFYSGGEAKILGVGVRVLEMPELKSFGEQGYPMTVTGARRAVLAPSGLPADVAALLEKTVREAVSSQDYRKRAADAGLAPEYASPEELRAEVRGLMNFFLGQRPGKPE